MTKTKIKAIIFDVNGVLLQIKGKPFREVFTNFISINLKPRFETLNPRITEVVINDVKTQKFIKKLSKILNIKENTLKNIFFKVYRSAFKENTQLICLMNQLKENYKLIILSDQIKLSQQAIFKYRLEKAVHYTFWSNKTGFRKPNIEAYKKVINSLKLPAKNYLFIDNQKWNLIPAKKLGMSTILYKNNKQLFKELKQLGVKW